ncbi:MAG: response regulator [Lachnospiraceae bacterium]|nr:response regulator [Lachnospiraceae bacterium]
MKVLLVDDAAFVRMSLKKVLEESDYEFTYVEAATGEEGINLFKVEKPDLTIMDITMPGMNGIEAVEKIIEIDPNAKIIMCSSMGYQEKVVDAITAGAVDFIVKPYTKEKILLAVEKVMKL